MAEPKDPVFVVGICDSVWVKHYVGPDVRLAYDMTIVWVFEVPEGIDAEAFARTLDAESCHHERDLLRVIRTAALWKVTMYVEPEDAKQFGKEPREASETLFSHYWVPMDPDDWDVQKIC